MICEKLIPAITGQVCSDLERDLLSLPTRLGGLGLTNPVTKSAFEFESSMQITAPLAVQDPCNPLQPMQPNPSKQKSGHKNKRNWPPTQICLKTSCHPSWNYSLSVPLRREPLLASQSTISGHGFNLHKGTFWDALCLRYGWQPSSLPQLCTCGASFTVNHAMTCHKGGFPTIRHNEICDLSASLWTRYATMWALSIVSNHLAENHLISAQSTKLMMPELISVL